tara:strand:+ start:303 stop:503 length:201 start_codon:yes stop_codon:yes gene_type:complete
MKKTLFITLLLFFFNFSVQTSESNNKCFSIKGVEDKLKCLKEKYENFRKNVPKTGVETYKKLKKVE